MAMRDLKHYLPGYKEEEEEDFNEWHTSEGEKRKYISAKVYLEYNDSVFAECYRGTGKCLNLLKNKEK